MILWLLIVCHLKLLCSTKMHTLFDIETQIPAFIHDPKASAPDSTAMKEIPFESNSYSVFDWVYNHFKMLYKIYQICSFSS